MGSVWLAQHLGLDIPCAIKSHERAGRLEGGAAPVRREAKVAAQIRSPHVVQILDHGVWQGTPYIAMEYLEGGPRYPHPARGAASTRTTRWRSRRRWRAPSRRLTRAAWSIAISPANIFLVRDDDREIAKVLDFGIAKDSTPQVTSTTKTGSLLGTPAHMSPEQAQGTKSIDHRSDLWSLAVVVFECLTGKLPFNSEAFGDLLLKIMVKPLPVPSQLAPVPPGFDAWWARAASREPEARFQSAKEFCDALAIALDLASESFEPRTSIVGLFRRVRRAHLGGAQVRATIEESAALPDAGPDSAAPSFGDAAHADRLVGRRRLQRTPAGPRRDGGLARSCGGPRPAMAGRPTMRSQTGQRAGLGGVSPVRRPVVGRAPPPRRPARSFSWPSAFFVLRGGSPDATGQPLAQPGPRRRRPTRRAGLDVVASATASAQAPEPPASVAPAAAGLCDGARGARRWRPRSRRRRRAARACQRLSPLTLSRAPAPPGSARRKPKPTDSRHLTLTRSTSPDLASYGSSTRIASCCSP